MSEPTASAVLTGMRKVSLNLATHFRDVEPDAERALGHQQEVEALDAVAELIEADKEYDAALLALQDLNRKIAEQGWMDVEFDALRNACMRLVKARQQRGDALARVGGAA